MIKGELVGGEVVASKMLRMAPHLKDHFAVAITRLTLLLMGRVKQDKLSGQVLNVRTGRLRRSINHRLLDMGTTSPAGTVGTNVSYGRTHELGYNGPVKAHLRLIKQAFGRPLKSPVFVQMPSRTMSMPERSFLRSALMELGPDIERETLTAVKEATK